LALGIDADYHYRENLRSGLQSGKISLIGTDGIWETTNAGGEMFGKARLKDLLRNHRKAGAEEIARAVIDAVDQFRGDARQTDDVTLVFVKLLGLSDGESR
jgi:serine phosphatase RsbU (regulator of sigma subunit)